MVRWHSLYFNVMVIRHCTHLFWLFSNKK